MIRTRIVELESIGGVAYRHKLKDGGSGITIIRYGNDFAAIATLDRRTGGVRPFNKFSNKDFPEEAFNEAIELTKGLPYGKKGNIKMNFEPVMEPVEEEAPPEEVATVTSEDYQRIVHAFTDKKGNLSYDLINKDFIKMAKKSNVVKRMIQNEATADEIIDYVVKNKVVNITKNKDLSDKQIKLIIQMLDEVSPKAVLKEFFAEIRKMIAR